MFLKFLRQFKSLPASFSPAFLSLGRKLLPQVSPLRTPVRSGLVNLATPCTGKALSASLALPGPALPSPPPSGPGTVFPPSPSPGLRAPTLAGSGLRVTNFSQPPAQGPGSQSAAGASWRVAAPGAPLCPLGTPRLCVRAAAAPAPRPPRPFFSVLCISAHNLSLNPGLLELPLP